MLPILTLRSRTVQTFILALLGFTFYTYHRTTDGELVRQYAFMRNYSRPVSSAITFEQVALQQNTTTEAQSTPPLKNATSESPTLAGSLSHNPLNNTSIMTVISVSSSSQIASSTNANTIRANFTSSSTTSTSTSTTTTTSTPPTTPLRVNKDLVSAVYPPGHTVTAQDKCPDFGQNMDLMIVIMSAPTHIEGRTAIRQTWAHYGQRKDIGIVFIIGVTSEPKYEQNLQKEQEIYGDIVRGRFVDSYTNLTLKSISTLEWIDTYCSEVRYVLKTDDDMFINVPKLMAFVNRHRKDRKIIFGKLARKWKPIRNKKSKYYLSLAQYKHPFFPDFTTGPAYLISSDIVHNLYETALTGTFIKLEDVYITGIVAQKLGVRRVLVNEFLNKKVPLNACNIQKAISIHMVKYSEQFDLWKKLLDGKSKCK